MDKLLLSLLLVSGGYLIGYLTRKFQERIGQNKIPELKETLEELKNQLEEELEDE